MINETTGENERNISLNSKDTLGKKTAISFNKLIGGNLKTQLK